MFEVAYCSFLLLRVDAALSMVTGLELEPGSPVRHMYQTAAESPEVSWFRVAESLMVVTHSCSLCWKSNWPISFFFISLAF